jgi:hypothetical protein
VWTWRPVHLSTLLSPRVDPSAHTHLLPPFPPLPPQQTNNLQLAIGVFYFFLMEFLQFFQVFIPRLYLSLGGRPLAVLVAGKFLGCWISCGGLGGLDQGSEIGDGTMLPAYCHTRTILCAHDPVHILSFGSLV